MVQLYTKKIFLKTSNEIIFKAGFIYSSINVYIADHDIYKHILWNYKQ